MVVTSADLRGWTNIGAQDAAKKTYASVKAALESSARLKRYTYEIFLQGSYANDTNTRGDSDVDIVAMLTSTFIPDVSRLSVSERQNYERHRVPGTSTIHDFRTDVQSALIEYYGARRIESKDKCLKVWKTDGYVDADVVPCYQYRAYTKYPLYGEPEWVEGVQIRPLSGGTIVNYPKRHRSNGSDKNDKTRGNYKPTVRQLKRLRRQAIQQGLLADGCAPGYLIECLTFNVPNDRLAGDDVSRVPLAVAWLDGFGARDLAEAMMSGDGIHKLFKTDPGHHDPNVASTVISAMRKLL